MKNQNRLLLCLTLISILATARPLLAVEPSATKPKPESWYQIEVLIYEPIEHALANENWPATQDENKPESLIELTPVAESNVLNTSPATLSVPATNEVAAFQQLPPENLTLAEIAGKLTRAGRYRIITLQGWQQPVKQRHEADTVHLTDKQKIPALLNNNEAGNPPIVDPQGNIILNPPTAALEPLFDETGLIVEETPARVDGTVTVSLSRYLHMALNMRYYNPDVYLAEQIALQKPDEVLIDTFELKQSRRMRSKEVHVFDHPYFGIIATIIPVERIIPEVEKEPAAVNTAPL